jgi:hypothetical protein
LGSDAGAGELLVSTTAWAAGGRVDVGERRALAVKGRTEPLEVVVLRGDASAVA